eukprot:gene10339-10405_t
MVRALHAILPIRKAPRANCQFEDFDRTSIPSVTARVGSHRHGASNAEGLRGSEAEEMCDVLESLNLGGFWSTDAAGRITYLSAPLHKPLVHEDSVVGKDFLGLFMPPAAGIDGQRTLPFVFARKGHFEAVIGRSKFSEAETLWSVSGVPAAGPDGEFAGFRGHIVDVTSDRQSAEEASQLRIIAVLSEPYTIEGDRCTIGASVGIAVSPFDGETVDNVVRNADLALYAAKHSGRGRFRFYSNEMLETLAMVRDLKIGHVQGYLFSKPVPVEAVFENLQAESWTVEPEGPAFQRPERRAMFRTIGVIHEDHYYPVTLRNLSVTGALIEGLLDVPIDTCFMVDFGEGQFELATVKRSRESHQGIHFDRELVSDGNGGLCTRHRFLPHHLSAAGVPRSSEEFLAKQAGLLATGKISMPRFAMANRAANGGCHPRFRQFAARSCASRRLSPDLRDFPLSLPRGWRFLAANPGIRASAGPASSGKERAMQRLSGGWVSGLIAAAALVLAPGAALAQTHGGGSHGGGAHGGGAPGGGFHGGGGGGGFRGSPARPATAGGSGGTWHGGSWQGGGGWHGGGWHGGSWHGGSWHGGDGYRGGGPYFWGPAIGLSLGYWGSPWAWGYGYPYGYYGYPAYAYYDYPAYPEYDYVAPAPGYAPPIAAPQADAPPAAAPQQQACGKWLWNDTEKQYHWVTNASFVAILALASVTAHAQGYGAPSNSYQANGIQDNGAQAIEALHLALRLSPAQETAWRAYRSAADLPNQAQQRRSAAAGLFRTLDAPDRMDLVEAEMRQELADLQRQSQALKAFYAALNPEQQRTFDTRTLPPPPDRQGPPDY